MTNPDAKSTHARPSMQITVYSIPRIFHQHTLHPNNRRETIGKSFFRPADPNLLFVRKTPMMSDPRPLPSVTPSNKGREKSYRRGKKWGGEGKMFLFPRGHQVCSKVWPSAKEFPFLGRLEFADYALGKRGAGSSFSSKVCTFMGRNPSR